jgi:hypothetical protein
MLQMCVPISLELKYGFRGCVSEWEVRRQQFRAGEQFCKYPISFFSYMFFPSS